MTAAAHPTLPAPSMALSLIDQLLREPSRILARIDEGDDSIDLSRTMLATIGFSGALFGAALGAYHSGLQALYGAVKLPLVILFTACICAPVLTMANRALGRRSSLQRDIALVLSSLALGGLVIAALAPLLLLAGFMNLSYHQTILLAFGACSVGGLTGLLLLWRGLGEERGNVWAALLLLGTFMLGGTQMAWTFRPYLVRPRTEGLPFMRAIEGNLFESILQTMDSARGYYPNSDLDEFAPATRGQSGDSSLRTEGDL